MHNVEMDLAAIKEDLGEVSRLPGAFFCDYAIFKNIYRVNARVMARSGMPIHIGLITVTDNRGEVPDVNTIKRVMAELQALVVEHLRRGDTVAMYSSTQLVLMLPQTTRQQWLHGAGPSAETVLQAISYGIGTDSISFGSRRSCYFLN